MLVINTFKYEKLKFLITGTGRCGTVFFAHLLTDMGIPCGHEHIFNFENKKKCISRYCDPTKRLNSVCSETKFLDESYNKKFVDPTKTVAESSYFLVPYLNFAYLQNIPLIHVARHPFKVIRSFVEDFKYFVFKEPNEIKVIGIYENFIYSVYPEIKNYDTPYDRAAQYYISCNKKILEQEDKRPYLFIKIEEIQNKKKELEKLYL